MNEQKKAKNDYANPNISKQQQSAEEMIYAVNQLLRAHGLSSNDFFLLNKMLKQLKTSNNSLPRKVLRGMQERIIFLQDKYNHR